MALRRKEQPVGDRSDKLNPLVSSSMPHPTTPTSTEESDFEHASSRRSYLSSTLIKPGMGIHRTHDRPLPLFDDDSSSSSSEDSSPSLHRLPSSSVHPNTMKVRATPIVPTGRVILQGHLLSYLYDESTNILTACDAVRETPRQIVLPGSRYQWSANVLPEKAVSSALACEEYRNANHQSVYFLIAATEYAEKFFKDRESRGESARRPPWEEGIVNTLEDVKARAKKLEKTWDAYPHDLDGLETSVVKKAGLGMPKYSRLPRPFASFEEETLLSCDEEQDYSLVYSNLENAYAIMSNGQKRFISLRVRNGHASPFFDNPIAAAIAFWMCLHSGAQLDNTFYMNARNWTQFTERMKSSNPGLESEINATLGGLGFVDDDKKFIVERAMKELTNNPGRVLSDILPGIRLARSGPHVVDLAPVVVRSSVSSSAETDLKKAVTHAKEVRDERQHIEDLRWKQEAAYGKQAREVAQAKRIVANKRLEGLTPDGKLLRQARGDFSGSSVHRTDVAMRVLPLVIDRKKELQHEIQLLAIERRRKMLSEEQKTQTWTKLAREHDIDGLVHFVELYGHDSRYDSDIKGQEMIINISIFGLLKNYASCVFDDLSNVLKDIGSVSSSGPGSRVLKSNLLLVLEKVQSIVGFVLAIRYSVNSQTQMRDAILRHPDGNPLLEVLEDEWEKLKPLYIQAKSGFGRLTAPFTGGYDRLNSSINVSLGEIDTMIEKMETGRSSSTQQAPPSRSNVVGPSQPPPKPVVWNAGGTSDSSRNTEDPERVGTLIHQLWESISTKYFQKKDLSLAYAHATRVLHYNTPSGLLTIGICLDVKDKLENMRSGISVLEMLLNTTNSLVPRYKYAIEIFQCLCDALDLALGPYNTSNLEFINTMDKGRVDNLKETIVDLKNTLDDTSGQDVVSVSSLMTRDFVIVAHVRAFLAQVQNLCNDTSWAADRTVLVPLLAHGLCIFSRKMGASDVLPEGFEELEKRIRDDVILHQISRGVRPITSAVAPKLWKSVNDLLNNAKQVHTEMLKTLGSQLSANGGPIDFKTVGSMTASFDKMMKLLQVKLRKALGKVFEHETSFVIEITEALAVEASAGLFKSFLDILSIAASYLEDGTSTDEAKKNAAVEKIKHQSRPMLLCREEYFRRFVTFGENIDSQILDGAIDILWHLQNEEAKNVTVSSLGYIWTLALTALETQNNITTGFKNLAMRAIGDASSRVDEILSSKALPLPSDGSPSVRVPVVSDTLELFSKEDMELGAFG